MRNSTLVLFNAILISSTLAQTDGQSPPSYPSPWMSGDGGWQDAYRKATAFVGKLTLLEKVNLTTGVGWQEEGCVGNTGSVPRLGFRSLCTQDSPLGVRFGTPHWDYSAINMLTSWLADYVSAFPAGVNAASTWSRALLRARGQAMGAEHRGKGVDVQLGPVAGPLGRVPEGGRNWEGFSPDPVLTGVAIGETIKGIQDMGVIACAKHFIMNEQEHYREQLSANIDDKALHETYLWPFADAVKAGVGAVMCSYNQLNNSYACQNSWTLNQILKKELDFQGFVMSDWNAQHSGVASSLAGLDMTMPGDIDFGTGVTHWGGNLTASVVNGTIPQWRIDDMVVRIMAAYYKVGRDRATIPINFNSWTKNTTGWEHYSVQDTFTTVNSHINVQDDYAKLIREIGGRSTVLLKNSNNFLPLSRPKSIAVIGEDAHLNPAGINGCPDRNCDNGTLAMGWGSGTADFPYLIAPVDALRAKASQTGSSFRNYSNDFDLAGAAAAARGASAAVVFVNADSGEAYIDVDGNAGDRNNLTLWKNGDALVAAVAAVNPNTIVVLHTVGPVLLGAIASNPNVKAILWAGLPGQESGNAITDVLYGAVNPSAKSVFTWGAARGDWGVDVLYNSSDKYPQQSFPEGNLIDYRWFDAKSIAPTYEFGFGLSYTTFKYSNLHVSKQRGAQPYVPASGYSRSAPTFGTIDRNPNGNEFPTGFRKVKNYVYSFIGANVSLSGGGLVPPHSQDSSPQPVAPAGGAPGGNPGLYEVLYDVSADITNTGHCEGIEVVQLYISLGGPTDPKIVLRGFDDLDLQPGQTKTFKYSITRRDISNWDAAKQNWFVSGYPKTVFVGRSSRGLPLSSKLS